MWTAVAPTARCLQQTAMQQHLIIIILLSGTGQTNTAAAADPQTPARLLV